MEGEIRNLYFYPPKNKESVFADDKRELLKNFWEFHVQPVIKYSLEMADKYGADKEVVWLGAMLHDIGILYNGANHDESGAKKADEILRKEGFDKETIHKVSGIVLKHRVKKYPPESLEEKVVATADAMSHFLPSYYLGIAIIAKDDYAGIIENNFLKLEKDYRKKMFFEDEKKQFDERVAEFNRWFGKMKQASATEKDNILE